MVDQNDLLYKNAIKFRSLKNIGYNIIVGRKKKAYMINLRFPKASFFHLAGMQHLTDIKYGTTNKERIFENILSGDIKMENIQKSEFFEEYFIRERLENLLNLEHILDNGKLIFQINKNKYIQFSTIKADFLLRYEVDIILDFFTVKNDIYQNYVGCSFFKEHTLNYTQGTSKSTLLKNVKINNDSDEEIVLYQNPNYKEEI